MRLAVFGTIALLGAVLVGGGIALTSCTVTVESGEMGIRQTRIGANPGVQLTELPPGFYFEGIGEKIRVYETRQRTYSYTREANSDGAENEEIGFSDLTGLPLTADVNLTFKVQENKAADLYATWRQPFSELLDGQIRNDVRSAIAREAERVPVSCSVLQASAAQSAAAEGSQPQPVACPGQLLGGGRQAVIQRALATLRAKWAPQGVDIQQMEWVGNIRYPASITRAIEERTQIEQATLAAQQQEARARALANAQIETARGIAESTRLRGEALRANPEIIDQIYAERSQGLCPPGAQTCIIGQGAWGLTNHLPPR